MEDYEIAEAIENLILEMIARSKDEDSYVMSAKMSLIAALERKTN